MKYKSVLFISLVVFVLDQITKYMIKTSMLLHESIPVLGDFFRITFVENTGMAFGISFGKNIFFTIFAAIASVAILVYFFTIKGKYLFARTAMAIIFGGALGNLVDRIFRGSVVDFLDFEFININIPAFDLLFIHFPGYSMTRWPVFNIADIAITTGMILLLIFIAFDKENEGAAESAAL
ncbi:MAG TPA: signal peptidase II [bacterium]|nr:signal peptidase II [bacterium]HPN45802.1 signal peptidase II [bacterium]